MVTISTALAAIAQTLAHAFDDRTVHHAMLKMNSDTEAIARKIDSVLAGR
jgi:hypothetical protein